MELLHQPGDIIAERYRIVTILGQGGIGTTYEAEDLQNYKRVALKTLSLRRLADWKVFELFEREARVLSHLNHPAIPKYLNYFQVNAPQNHCFYLVQELAPGRSLAVLVEGGWRADEAEVKYLAMQILEILCYLHSLTPPVVHRDIKPQNIIRQADGKVFLVDFGAVQDTYRNALTRGSTVVGTYGYMAPEQFRGQAVPATDLYGLGATLLFVLTHCSPVDLPQRKLKIDFRHIQISVELADWLETMLEPAVEERLQTASEASAVLSGKQRLVSSSLVQHRPAGSHITLTNTSERLVVNIPPVGLKLQSLLLIISAIFAAGFIIIFTRSAFSGLSLVGWLIIIPFWTVALDALRKALFCLVGRTLIKIERQTFQIQWNFLGLNYQVQGQTKNISRVGVDTIINSVVYKILGPPRPYAILETACTVVEGVRTHYFGQFITQLEKEWLLEELTAFLKRL